jgi:heme/copper-type cytochrome/quinol oxidase subunit 3
MEGDRKNAIISLGITVFLGVYFSTLQAHEYQEAPFTIADRIYGTTFFVATGFHGLHVLIGSIFLGVCFFRLLAYQFSPGHHIGFETAA